MYKIMGFSTICLAISLFVAFSFFPEKRGKALHISGSTTIEPFMKTIATQFQTKNDLKIRITAPGSISGMDALMTGSCDIAMSSSDLLPRHLALAEKKGIAIKSFLLGYDVIVPIVHPANGVSNISLAQLKEKDSMGKDSFLHNFTHARGHAIAAKKYRKAWIGLLGSADPKDLEAAPKTRIERVDIR